MSKKNKRVAALITAVFVLALTVAGSLTVSAASEPISTAVSYEFIPQNGQLTAKVTAWDSSCVGLYFTVDGEIVGNNFKVDIVGPVSEYVGTLAYCDKLTTGEHTIGITQVNSAGSSYPSSSTTKYYFTSMSSSYVLGGRLTLAETPENLSNLNLYTRTSSFFPGAWYNDLNYSFKYGDYYYFVSMDFDYDEDTLYIGRYHVGDTTLARDIIYVKHTSGKSYYFGVNDVVYYNSCLYFYGVDYSSSKYGYSTSYHKTSSLYTYSVPMSAIINAFSSNTSSTTSTIYLNSYTKVSNLPCYEYFDDYYIYKTSRIFIDDTYYHKQKSCKKYKRAWSAFILLLKRSEARRIHYSRGTHKRRIFSGL